MAFGAQTVREWVRRTGFDVVRYPLRRPGWSLDTLMRALFERRRITHVIDVGARNGEHGLYLRSLGFEGKIVSFEPVEAHFERLSAEARADGRWTAHRAALGRESGELELSVAVASDFTSFRRANERLAGQFPDGAKVDRVERVKVRRLDEVFAEVLGGAAGASVLLKMDTQGWDLEVLAGSSGCLDGIVAVQSEVSIRPLYEGAPTYLDTLAHLSERGFVLAGLFPVSWVEQAGEVADPTRLIECDAVCVRD